MFSLARQKLARPIRPQLVSGPGELRDCLGRQSREALLLQNADQLRWLSVTRMAGRAAKRSDKPGRSFDGRIERERVAWLSDEISKCRALSVGQREVRRIAALGRRLGQAAVRRVDDGD